MLVRTISLVLSLTSVALWSKPATAGETGDRYALVIGIAGYPGYAGENQLHFSDRDAKDFSQFIQSTAGGATPEKNVRLLINEKATRTNITAALNWLGNTVTSDDLVYVFFAGHGEVDSLGRAYLMPFDADPKLPDALGLRADDFLSEVKTVVSAKRLVFFIDACHAGAALTQGGSTGTARSKNLSPMLRDAWERAFHGVNVNSMGLFAASSNQLSWEAPDLKHGLFTFFLLQGLRGAADQDKNGIITASELYRYLLDKVETLSSKRYSTQTPTRSPSWDPYFPLALYPKGVGEISEVNIEPQKEEQVSSARSFREARAAHYFESTRQQSAALVQFIREMPKGGDLHSHLTGAVYAEDLVDFAVSDGLCVESASSVLRAPPCDPCEGYSQKPAIACAYSSSELYGRIVDAWSMRDWKPGAESGHDHFYHAFNKFSLATHNHIPEIIASAMNRAARDHVQYVELMHTADANEAVRLGMIVGWEDNLPKLRDKLLSAGLKEVVASTSKTMSEYDSRARTELKCGEKEVAPGCAVSVRYLYQVLRGLQPEVVFSQLLVGFELASSDTRFVGLNLVMPEDWYTPMHDFKLHMDMLDYLHNVYPKVHISLHAGELNPTMSGAEQNHIAASVKAGHAERIGHATYIAYEDNSKLLLEDLVKHDVLVETCLTSDELVLDVSGSNHPFPLLLQSGVPTALSTNDAGILRTNMSLEFLKATERYELGYLDLKQMARQSLQHSFVPGETLWADRNLNKFVVPCASDDPGSSIPSQACYAFLSASEKAKLQWELEHQFADFEQQF